MTTSTLLACLLAFVAISIDNGAESLELTLLHTNDMHSRLEPITGGGTTCTPTSSKCYGGFARVKSYAESIRKTNKNVLFLNGGDNFQGTPYYSVYKWKIIRPFVDSVGIDVMSLGNHEFDDGVEGLAPYLAVVKTPSVCANIDISKEPTLQTVNLHKYRMVTFDNTTIAVIGYLTTDTKFLSRMGNVDIMDEVEALRATAKEAKEKGASLVFAVGHAGYEMDCKIGEEVEDVDLVVGGHTDTFLYTGTPPDREVPASTYPHMVTQKSGKKVPVVQAYGYTKYVGNLQVVFDDDHKLVSAVGNPVLMEQSLPQDPDVEEMTNFWKTNLTERLKEKIGDTYVDLSYDGCKKQECNLGNLITDAFRSYAAERWTNKDDGWTDTPVAFVNAGSLRASISYNETKGVIRRGSALTVMPFTNELMKLRVTGAIIKQMLERGVARYDLSGVNLYGAFPQVSGIHVTYDLTEPPFHRVVKFQVQCGKCNVPTYYSPDPNEEINIITNAYVAGGGDEYSMLIDHPHKEYLAVTDFNVFEDYIRKSSPLKIGIENRINFVTEAKDLFMLASSGTLSRPSYLATSLSLFTYFMVKRHYL